MSTKSAVPRWTASLPSGPALFRWAGVAAGTLALVAVAWVLGRFPVQWATALVLTGICGALLLLRPALGLALLAFAIPFGSLRMISLGPLSISLAQPILGAVLLTAVAQRCVQRRSVPPVPKLALATVAYVGALGLSLLQAGNLSAAVTELVKWLEFGALIVYLAHDLEEGDARLLVVALLAAGLLQGLLGIYQFVRQVGPPGFVLFGRYMRAHGTFSQPNPYAGYLGILLPLAAAILLVSVQERRQARGSRRWISWLLPALATVALGGMAAGLVMSWSRGALLGAVAGLGLMLLTSVRRAWPVVLALALLAAVLAPAWMPIIPGGYLARLSDLGAYVGQDLRLIKVNDENFAVIERLAHWQAAWAMFSQSPWTGVGLGQYPEAYAAVALPRWQDPLGHAHNYYLHALAETGMVGLGTYLLLLLSAGALAWREAHRAAGWRRAMALGAIGMLGHLAVHSLFDNLYVHDMTLLVALLLGLTAWSAARGAACPPASLQHLGATRPERSL